jgi:hypothetical protein
MGNYLSTNTKETSSSYFQIERIIDSDPPISVGPFVPINRISGHRHFTSYQNQIHVQPASISSIDSYKHQGIRIGDDKTIHQLVQFSEQPNSIHYEFKNGIHLTFTKPRYFIESTKDTPLFYTLKTDSMNITKEVPAIIRNNYKPILLNSTELDAIYEYLQKK